jgi:membrane protease YdiL (CAAX protease family)
MAWIISNHQDLLKQIWYEIKTGSFSNRMIVFNLIGLQLGILIALYFRFLSQLNVLPKFFTWFIITAFAIAIIEECFFRGVIQPMAATINYYAAPPIAALMHSTYKVMIFIPLSNSNPNIQSLFIGSLVAFLGLGYLKQFSRNIVPAIIAHVAFDVLVYAEYVRAPWWVW